MRLRYLLVKELLQMRRNPAMLRMAVFMPIMQTLLLSFAANMDVTNVPLTIWDADRSPQSRALVQMVGSSNAFVLKGYRMSPEELEHDLDSARASLCLVIPAGFARDVERGEATLQVLVDGTESTTTTVAAAYIAQMAGDFGAQVQRKLVARRGLHLNLGQITPVPRVLYNPDARTLWFMAPAIMALVLTTLMQNITALSIARERELGTLEQLVMTPVRPAEILLGKLVPVGVIGLFDAGLVSVIVVHALHVPFRGSVALLALATIIFLFAVLGLGLLVSTVSHNQQQAQLTNFFLSYPSMLLSGFIFPVWNLPAPLQPVSRLVPMTHFLEITRGVFLRGSDASALAGHLAWMAGLATAFFVVGALRFHKRLD
ncbi:MAG: ABC transporter permease [Armatimonadetes bacterium]|nr:ABC transporter permease [Armatimonadota bacterium]